MSTSFSAAPTHSHDPQSTATLRLTRVFAAPREAAFRAWTEPDALAQWWWLARFGTVYDVDLRVGGHYRFKTVDVPGMGVLEVGGVFLEVRAPERLIYTWRWAGDETETRVTVEFRDQDDRTEVVLTHEGFAGAAERDNHAVGWTDCLDRLDDLVQSDALLGQDPLRSAPRATP